MNVHHSMGKPFFCKHWFKQKHWSWWVKHLLYLRDRPTRYLEIGVLEGRSLCWVMNNLLVHPDSSAVGIDLWEDEIVGWPNADARLLEARARQNTAEYGPRVELVRGDSAKVIASWRGQRQFDLVYIDGSHEPLAVMTDACLAWKILAPGGVMVWDDVAQVDVEAVVKAFLLTCAGSYKQVWASEYQIAVRRL